MSLVDDTIKKLEKERQAARSRVDAITTALAALAIVGYGEDEPHSAISGARMVAEVVDTPKRHYKRKSNVVHQKLGRKRLARSRWRQKTRWNPETRMGEPYAELKRTKKETLHRRKCLFCHKGFLGRPQARFDGKKCADNYYTRHVRNKVKVEKDKKVNTPISRPASYYEARSRAGKAGAAVRWAHVYAKRAEQKKYATKGVEILPGDAVKASEK